MRKRVINIAVIVINIILIVLFFQININRTSYAQTTTHNITLGGISKNNVVIQEIPIVEDIQVDNVKIELATYARNNKNTNSAEIWVNDKQVYTNEFSSSNLKDNKLNNIFNKDLDLELEKGDIVKLVLSSEDADGKNIITAWGNKNDKRGNLYTKDANGTMTKVEGTINFQFSYDTSILENIVSKYQNYPHVIFFIIAILTLGIVAFTMLMLTVLMKVFLDKEPENDELEDKELKSKES